MIKTARLLFLLTAVVLTGCAQYATVAERRAQFRSAHVTATTQAMEQKFVAALRREKRDPLEAMGAYLEIAESAAGDLRKNPQDESARSVYNFAVARVFTCIRISKKDPWTSPLQVPADSGQYQLTPRIDPLRRKAWNPALYEFIPADEFDVKGTYVTERTVKAGVGAPMVAIGKDKREDARAEFVAEQTFYGVTAVLHFAGKKVTVAFEDPLATEEITFEGRRMPMAADFTVPLAVMLARENPKKLEIARVLRPEKYAETAHITRLQPYDPNKTVVLVVHGLMDSPATWTPMLNTLRGDPAIRDHFQFWYYSYPSGYPYPYSAAIMRHELDAIEKRYPLKKKMILVGHSMGSLISRLMITDSGDRLWLSAFGKPPAETHFTPETRAKLEEALIFKHRSEVGRVIFISGPHRGSDLARNWFGRFASGLVKAPVTLLKVSNEMREALVSDSSALHLKRLPNSIDTLAPNNRFVKALADVPITPGIPYHSIMGDRGRGDTPNSSDGVVPYWSSHLDGAQSELIVPSHHSAHQNPQAIAEVQRILRQAAKN